MPETFTHDVFLSHSSKDKAVVRALAERLEKDGLKVWFDEWALLAGDNLLTKIDDGLEHSRVLILCMSAHFFASNWTHLESATRRFLDPLNKDRRFIPLRLDDAPIKGSLAQFLHIQWSQEDSDEAYAKLLEACRQSMNTADPPSTGQENLSRNDNPSTMSTPPANAVQPLYIAEDRFLQILLSKFTLTREDRSGISSFELGIEFDDNTDAIWDQNGKHFLRRILTEDMRDRFQLSLDEFFSGGGPNPYRVDNPEFFFRYASGGTLVTVEFEGLQRPNRYYCLFYRDVHPIGWNIANGGTDTRAELLNPQETINRELREELIIADFVKNERYVFPVDDEKAFDHPAHAAARRLWKRKFPNRDLDSLQAVPINIETYRGPDSLRIKMGGYDKEIRREGFFLNINGRDFGIEFDCVATIRGLPRHITLFDGEVDGGRLVNCPVGLFEAERFEKWLDLNNQNERQRRPEESYVPDFFYFGDKKIEDGFELTEILKTKFLEHVRPIRAAQEIEEFQVAIAAKRHLGLCPVTKTIATRYLKSKAPQR